MQGESGKIREQNVLEFYNEVYMAATSLVPAESCRKVVIG